MFTRNRKKEELERAERLRALVGKRIFLRSGWPDVSNQEEFDQVWDRFDFLFAPILLVAISGDRLIVEHATPNFPSPIALSSQFWTCDWAEWPIKEEAP